jgi:uncharacterized protein
MSELNEEELQLLEDAAHAYNAGHFSEAFPTLKKFAELGNIEAICGLSQMYLRGEGVAANVEKGLGFLHTAAEMGHANSAFSLGALFRNGAYGVTKDVEKSKYFLRLAKELGCEISVDAFLD